jgi:predicted negative regulator of RcsB-dependent stress response
VKPAAALLLLLASAGAGQQPSANQVSWWSGSWDGAFAEAKIRNVPVLVVFIQDGEDASERTVTGTFKDPEYVKLTNRCLAIVVSLQFHGIKKEEVGGVVKGVCSKFGATTCEAHQTLETPARVELCGDHVQTPQHVLVLPDRTIVDRIVDVAPVSGYQELVARGVKKLGKGLTNAELKQVRDQLRDAEARLEKQDWAGAIKVAKEAMVVTKGTPFAKQAEAIVARIEGDAKKQIERADAAAKGGDYVIALRILENGVDQFAGTETVAVLKKELARVKGTKAGSEAARVLAKEKRGQDSFDAGQAAEKAKDFVTARREYQKAASLASGTPLAERAQMRIDELAKDPDIKALFDRADKDQKATAALKEADKLLAAGNREGARAAFKKVLEDFAGTPAAAAAKTKLEGLD